MEQKRIEHVLGNPSLQKVPAMLWSEWRLEIVVVHSRNPLIEIQTLEAKNPWLWTALTTTGQRHPKQALMMTFPTRSQERMETPGLAIQKYEEALALSIYNDWCQTEEADLWELVDVKTKGWEMKGVMRKRNEGDSRTARVVILMNENLKPRLWK
jgi:hypothetical protein